MLAAVTIWRFPLKIIVDAMGGDHAPESIVAGVVEAIKEFDVDIALIGQEDRVKSELSKYEIPSGRIEIIHAAEVITMHEPATVSLRQKKNSSISEGVKLLKDAQYDAFISAGNTGAVVAASTIFLGMLEGVARPAIGLTLPTVSRFSFLIDVGANAEPKPEHLVQSAQMGSIYVRDILRVKNPTVGLLNIGEEASKGSIFSKETYKLMDGCLENFIGNIEANEVFSGKCDCIVSDGVIGNVVIKVAQGLMESAATLMRREIKKSPMAVLGAILMKSRLGHIKKLADYSEYGGAPLLGVNGVVMISHGRSSPKAIKNAIRATIREVEHNLLAVMTKEVTSVK